MVTLHTFDLCKKLHELKPDWTPEDRLFIRREGDNPEVVKDPKFIYRFDQAPRFTVGYLLEKLPNRITNNCCSGVLMLIADKPRIFKNGWMAGYIEDTGQPMQGNLYAIGKTALDALLNLAIEMAESEEI
jgi:hypothetical protein